jgi:hypothetical protein
VWASFAKAKNPDAPSPAKTPQRFQPQNRVPQVREASLGIAQSAIIRPKVVILSEAKNPEEASHATKLKPFRAQRPKSFAKAKLIRFKVSSS